MGRYEKVLDRLRNGQRILIDGGTGTEIESRGVVPRKDAWISGGTLSHSDVVRSIHEDFIRGGAEIIISNTFAASRNVLCDVGAEHQFENCNRVGVELACQARDKLQSPDVLVAGSIAYWSFTKIYPPLDEIERNAAEQVKILADAGADLLMLEMMVDIDRMLVMLGAAQTSGLPVWVGLSCEPDENGTMCLYNKEPLADALAALADKDVAVVNIMHTDVIHIDACLEIVEDHWPGIVGVYAHSGKFVNPTWVFDDTISPQEYAAHSARWLKRNVQVIGGCCGIRPDHIAALSEIV